MKKLIAITMLFLFLFSSVSFGQRRVRDRSVMNEGFYINMGVAVRPDFSDFFDSTNSYYQTRFLNQDEKLDRFGSGFNFGIGYLVRLYPNFALDVGFSIYRLKSAGRITNRNLPPVQFPYVDHDLEYQVGIFSATIPVLLDFDPRQPAVPYFGIGISIFSMRLDDFRDDGVNIPDILRETNTSVGGHFEAGLFIKIKKKIWIDIKGRWHSGSAKLRAAEPAPPADYGSFKVKQDVTQFTLGVVYYFR